MEKFSFGAYNKFMKINGTVIVSLVLKYYVNYITQNKAILSIFHNANM